MARFDAVIVGAGHNALITGAYLVQAGYHVCIFEKRDVPGGAASSAEIVPGYRFDLGGGAHVFIRLTPILEELQLQDHGLEYIEIDPLFYVPLEDGRSLFLWRDVGRTEEELERVFPGEGKAYRQFVEDWSPLARSVKEMFLTTPGPFDLGRKLLKSRAMGGAWRRAVQFILRPYGEILDEYFANERLKAALVWMAAQSGPPPTEPLTGPFLLWHPLYHVGGIAYPRGGSGELSESLVRHIRSYGGEVHLGTPVDEIIVEKGRAAGVSAGGRTYRARAVISGAHAAETFHRLLPESSRPPRSPGLRIGDGFGAALRLALRSQVSYQTEDNHAARTALQLLCPNRRQITAAYGDGLKGRIPEDPPMRATTFTAVDPSLAPPGGEVLSIWAQYYPYELATGSWDEIAEEAEDRLLEAYERYAPGTRGKVVGSLFQHPLWIERHLGLPRGNVMHLDMSIDQMFMMRPLPDYAQYRTPTRGLYLTGASTHPGGGIMGASGRNAAYVVLKDLDRKRI